MKVVYENYFIYNILQNNRPADKSIPHREKINIYTYISLKLRCLKHTQETKS